MNIIKFTTLSLTSLLLICGAQFSKATVVYTDIGSFTTGNFTLDEGSTYFPTQSVAGLNSNLTVAAGDTFYGVFTAAPRNWSTYTDFSLLMTASTSTAVPFTVYFVDSSSNIAATLTGTTAGLTTTASSNLLTAVPGSSPGNLASIVSFVFSWDGGGALNTTLVGVQGIPEPSTGALMMIGVAGLVALRRLRKV